MFWNTWEQKIKLKIKMIIPTTKKKQQKTKTTKKCINFESNITVKAAMTSREHQKNCHYIF